MAVKNAVATSDSKDANDNKPNVALPPAVPAPPYRHAAPSGPWPWMDFSKLKIETATTAVTTVTTDITTALTEDSTAMTDVPAAAAALADGSTAMIDIPSCEWSGYPQNLFGNWTSDQVERSQMLIKCLNNQRSIIYWMDMLNDGTFITPDMTRNGHTGTETSTNFWKMLKEERPGNIRVRSLFVDYLSSPVLRVLGTIYNIEPFFFTSSINWIPSRYQEALTHGKGDHITITLPFVRTYRSQLPTSLASTDTTPSGNANTRININTQAPFPMSNGGMLFIDLLAVHMVRDVKTSTIISYHPEPTSCQTSAKHLHSLTRLVGDSVYWHDIFSKTKDPTFLFLAILWYALYAWDESLELLYNHVSTLESEVLHESRIELTRQLHVLQAHLLHYQSLLHNFQVSVSFIQNTPNPAMESEEVEQRETSKELMKKEEENVMDLAFATVNLEDSKQTRRLTEATVRDSAAMKQISYLTMIFLPASFIASVFGMNVTEINPGSLETLAHYVEITISLTLLTVYVVVTLQKHTSFHEENAEFHQRAAWPYLFLRRRIRKKMEKITAAKAESAKGAKTVNEENATIRQRAAWLYHCLRRRIRETGADEAGRANTVNMKMV